MSWETESEQMAVTPAMKRRIWKGVLIRSEKVLNEFSGLTTEQDLFYEIPGAALAAYHLKRYSEAATLANSTLGLAESFKDSWNYSNAIHHGHTVLGLLALRDGDLQKALTELHASANVEASPQLASFGPLMQLAKELLEQGEAPQVLLFLHQCTNFWESGEAWITVWEKKISNGAIPNFFMHLYR